MSGEGIGRSVREWLRVSASRGNGLRISGLEAYRRMGDCISPFPGQGIGLSIPSTEGNYHIQ